MEAIVAAKKEHLDLLIKPEENLVWACTEQSPVAVHTLNLSTFPSTSFGHANQWTLSWTLPSHDSGVSACQGPLPKCPCHGVEEVELTHANEQCPAPWLQGYRLDPDILFRSDIAYEPEDCSRKDAMRHDGMLKSYKTDL